MPKIALIPAQKENLLTISLAFSIIGNYCNGTKSIGYHPLL